MQDDTLLIYRQIGGERCRGGQRIKLSLINRIRNRSFGMRVREFWSRKIISLTKEYIPFEELLETRPID